MADRLYRSQTDRVIAGVAGGLAAWLRIDPSIVRVGWVVLAVLTGGIFLLVYIVMMIVVPLAPDGWVPSPGPPPGGSWVPPPGGGQWGQPPNASQWGSAPPTSQWTAGQPGSPPGAPGTMGSQPGQQPGSPPTGQWTPPPGGPGPSWRGPDTDQRGDRGWVRPRRPGHLVPCRPVRAHRLAARVAGRRDPDRRGADRRCDAPEPAFGLIAPC